MAQGKRPSRRDRIVDAAIDLAEEAGWADLRLYQVAERLKLPLAELQAEFRDLDAVANAWFGRALAQLARTSVAELTERPPPERLYIAIMAWFDALAPHRRVTGDMLRAKLYPSHPHHWGPLIFDLSRLVHWLLDVARIESTGRRRQLAEIGLTAISLATLRTWLRDDSEGQARTREQLQRRLRMADRWLARLP